MRTEERLSVTLAGLAALGSLALLAGAGLWLAATGVALPLAVAAALLHL